MGGSVNWAAFGDKAQKDTFSVRPSPGFTAGALIIFPLKKNYNVLIEGAFSQKSRVLKDRLLTNSSTYHFIDATLLLRKSYKFRISKDVPADWFINLGPEIGYWLNGKGDISAEGPGYPYIIEFNKPPEFRNDVLYYNSANRWLFGLAMGIGMKAPLGRNQSISTELRFISGHTHLGKTPYEYPVHEWYGVLNYVDTLKMNLKVVTISVAYTFDLDVLEARKGKSTLDRKVKQRR